MDEMRLRRAVDRQLYWLALTALSKTAAYRLGRWPSAEEIRSRKKEISDWADLCSSPCDLSKLLNGLWLWRKKGTWTFPNLNQALTEGRAYRR